jgi:hypothetical protein
MQKSATQILNGTFGSTRSTRSSYQIADNLAGYFPAAEFPDYEAFVAALGSSLKRERRTDVTVLKRHVPDSSGGFASFVLKVYRYPFFPRIRTGFQISKAEREFHALRYLNENGVTAAQGVGYGVERDRFGFVRSCFIITRLIDDAINLSQWSKRASDQEKLDEERASRIFSELGECFRRLHQAHFFLFTAKAKNILIPNVSTSDNEVCFIDLPYARILKWRALARWAQARDIGLLFANVNGAFTETAIAGFYRTYLPDPLENSSEAVRRFAHRQMRSKQNRTVISRWVHNIKRRLAGKAPLAGSLLFSVALYG